MNPVRIEVSTKLIDQNNLETEIRLSSDFDHDYLQLLLNRKEVVEKCLKNGWKAVQATNATHTQHPVTNVRGTAASSPTTSNQRSGSTLFCKHNVPAKLIRSKYKTGSRTGEDYSAWACPKEKKDSCGFFEYTPEFIPQNHQPMRDLESENQAAHADFEKPPF